jgi:predicted RNA-binding protein with PIN domain
MSLSMLDDEDLLIKMLVNYSRASRKHVTVFFDNAPPGTVKTKRFGSLKVYFVREGRSADSAIISMLIGLGKNAKNWTVVSSDRDVQRNAKSLGARIISSEEFALSLMRGLKKDDKSQDLKKENYPDEGEVKRWLEIFSDETPEEL